MNKLKEKQKALLKQFTDQSDERDKLIEKDDPTVEDLENVKKANTSLKTIKQQIDELGQQIKDIEELDGFRRNPVFDISSGSSESDPEQPGKLTAKNLKSVVLGVKSDGTIGLQYDKKTGQYEYEDPQGLTQKQWDAISDPAYPQALSKYLRVAGNALLVKQNPLDHLDKIELKVLEEGSDGAGGFLVPVDEQQRLIQKTAAPTRVNGLVETITTSRDRISMPRVIYTTDDIYTTGIRVTLSGERPPSSTSHRVTDPVFGQAEIPVGTWMMSMPITNDLLEDNAFGLMSWSMGKFEETIGLLYDNQILNGTGVGSYPRGIMINPGGDANEPAVTLSSTANNIDADQLRGMPFDIPEQYINDVTRWVYQRGVTGRAIALLKDSQNRYLFQEGQTFPGLQGRSPDTLVGYPIAYSAFQTSLAASAYCLLFGDLRGYAKVNRIGFSVRVLTERYAEDNQVVLLGRLRWGGKLLEPWRMRIGKAHNA